jgi:hypothetical protein
MSGDPFPGYKPGEAACSLGPRRDCLEPAEVLEDLRTHPGAVELRTAGHPVEADLVVRPASSSQHKLLC